MTTTPTPESLDEWVNALEAEVVELPGRVVALEASGRPIVRVVGVQSGARAGARTMSSKRLAHLRRLARGRSEGRRMKGGSV
jgi:hypothetical protein